MEWNHAVICCGQSWEIANHLVWSKVDDNRTDKKWEFEKKQETKWRVIGGLRLTNTGMKAGGALTSGVGDIADSKKYKDLIELSLQFSHKKKEQEKRTRKKYKKQLKETKWDLTGSSLRFSRCQHQLLVKRRKEEERKGECYNKKFEHLTLTNTDSAVQLKYTDSCNWHS